MKQGAGLAGLTKAPEDVVRIALRDAIHAFESYIRRSHFNHQQWLDEKVSLPGQGAHRGRTRRFGVSPQVEVLAKALCVSGLGRLRLKRKDYLPTGDVVITDVVVQEKAGRWFVTLQVEAILLPHRHGTEAIVGVDLGIKNLATLSDGTTVKNPRATQTHAVKTRQLQQALARKQKGSTAQKTAALKLARHQMHVASIRRHQMHCLTAQLLQNYSCIAIENLDVPGMIRSTPRYSSAIQDVGFGQFRRQMEYKANLTGRFVVVAPRYFPSSGRCSNCGALNRSLSIETRRWRCCECGREHDRDENAALNLEGLIAGSATVMPVEEVVQLSYGMLMAQYSSSPSDSSLLSTSSSSSDNRSELPKPEPSSDVQSDVV